MKIIIQSNNIFLSNHYPSRPPLSQPAEQLSRTLFHQLTVQQSSKSQPSSYFQSSGVVVHLVAHALRQLRSAAVHLLAGSAVARSANNLLAANNVVVTAVPNLLASSAVSRTYVQPSSASYPALSQQRSRDSHLYPPERVSRTTYV